MEVDVKLLREPFPREAIKERKGAGGMMLSYVQGHTVINRLNHACPAWDLQIVNVWTEGAMMLAHVRLTLPGMGSREHVGVQEQDSRSGVDAMAKGAITDALKKAATLFGVGIELYGDDYETDHLTPRDIREAREVVREAPRPAPSTLPVTRAKPQAEGDDGPPISGADLILYMNGELGWKIAPGTKMDVIADLVNAEYGLEGERMVQGTNIKVVNGKTYHNFWPSDVHRVVLREEAAKDAQAAGR